MKAILPNLDEKSKTPMYLQIYDYVKRSILSGEIEYGAKLPSLRTLSTQLKVSLTTVDWAYSQLAVEGYIHSKSQSGYYVSHIPSRYNSSNDNSLNLMDIDDFAIPFHSFSPDRKYDTSCFDFTKWKKCISKVLNEYPHLLLFESDSQGELALRYEIAKYIYSSRGVKCNPSQIVISAGTQQTAQHLSKILREANIFNISLEKPGYAPVNKIFNDFGFQISYIDVLKDGIDIDRLPQNISSAVYVSPSNQFPTGSVMPIGNRYRLLQWANNNAGYIIEDDYDSELRYFGRPIPALQGLDENGRVIYLGSFSSTLFPAVKISYMVLPSSLIPIWNNIKNDYSQTCSKTEQLALAFFMEDGKYMQGIKRLRRLYSQKLNLLTNCLKANAGDNILISNTGSGITLSISVNSPKSRQVLQDEALSIGLQIIPSPIENENINYKNMIFYYNQIPIDDIAISIADLCLIWFDCTNSTIGSCS